jgi:hypothetical protein
MTDRRQTARDDVVLATVRDFADRSGAVRVAVMLDRGEGHAPPLIECEPGEPLTVSQGDESFVIPPQALAGVEPLPLSPPRPVPASTIDVDPVAARISAPIGAVDMLALGVAELARVLGGRTVAVADFGTRAGEPLTIAAREGEPTVLAVGDQQFELS